MNRRAFLATCAAVPMAVIAVTSAPAASTAYNLGSSGGTSLYASEALWPALTDMETGMTLRFIRGLDLQAFGHFDVPGTMIGPEFAMLVTANV